MQVIAKSAWAGGWEPGHQHPQVIERIIPELAGQPGAGGCKGCKGRWRGAGETTLGPHLPQPRCMIFKSID